MNTRQQVAAVQARLMPDAQVQALAPNIPVHALRKHLERRHFNLERVRMEAARAHVAVDAVWQWQNQRTEHVRVFWPDGTVDRFDEPATWTA